MLVSDAPRVLSLIALLHGSLSRRILSDACCRSPVFEYSEEHVFVEAFEANRTGHSIPSNCSFLFIMSGVASLQQRDGAMKKDKSRTCCPKVHTSLLQRHARQGGDAVFLFC